MTAREMHDETISHDAGKNAHFCSMCGPKWGALREIAEVAMKSFLLMLAILVM